VNTASLHNLNTKHKQTTVQINRDVTPNTCKGEEMVCQILNGTIAQLQKKRHITAQTLPLTHQQLMRTCGRPVTCQLPAP
jgi:hypothetical protein